MPDFNVQDPAKLDAIRKKPHAYVQGEGRHGTYVDRPYIHQEYPKIMDKMPPPTMKDFKGKADAPLLFENAMKEWEEVQRESTVHNKAQEADWLEQHANDPVRTIVDQMYPKTMDHTPAPNPAEFDTLEDLREAREAWKTQIAASIVRDKDEEELWIRSHQTGQRSAGRQSGAPVSEKLPKTGKKKSRAA